MKAYRLTWLIAGVAAGTLVLASCGGSTPSAPSSSAPSPAAAPSPAPAPSAAPGGATITITSSGVSPKSLTVPVGTRVTFVNNNTIAHDMASDPHPDHTDCVEINQAGFLTPGQSRQTGNLNRARTCGFHDHNQDQNRSLQGQIIIQ